MPPVLEIVIKISYSAKSRLPGDKPPGYFMTSLRDLNSFYYNILSFNYGFSWHNYCLLVLGTRSLFLGIKSYIISKNKVMSPEFYFGYGRMYSLGEVNFIQGMYDFGNPKNSVVHQGRNNAPVYKSINPLFFSGSANYKPGHYFCLDVVGLKPLA